MNRALARLFEVMTGARRIAALRAHRHGGHIPQLVWLHAQQGLFGIPERTHGRANFDADEAGAPPPLT